MQYANEYIKGLASQGATLVVVPGTDDRGGKNLLCWLKWFVELFSRLVVIDYPATVGPVVGGLRADRYDTSCAKAIAATTEAVRGISGKVVIVGYSQGAEAAWLAVAGLRKLGIKPDAEIELIVWGHPRSSTGFKPHLGRHHPLVAWLLERFCGAARNGAADEQLMGDIRVTSIAIVGDPVTAFEVWWKNPIGFVLNTIFGFFMTHAGLGRESASRVGTLSLRSVRQSADSSTTHVVLNAAHPVGQFLRTKGVRCDEGLMRVLAMLAPVTVPGEKSVSIVAIRRNWIVATRPVMVEALPEVVEIALEEEKPVLPPLAAAS